MIRSERLKDENTVRHEINTYNELLPRPGELTATMLLRSSQLFASEHMRQIIEIAIASPNVIEPMPKDGTSISVIRVALR